MFLQIPASFRDWKNCWIKSTLFIWNPDFPHLSNCSQTQTPLRATSLKYNTDSRFLKLFWRRFLESEDTIRRWLTPLPSYCTLTLLAFPRHPIQTQTKSPMNWSESTCRRSHLFIISHTDSPVLFANAPQSQSQARPTPPPVGGCRREWSAVTVRFVFVQ